jgi:hypothetical protein
LFGSIERVLESVRVMMYCSGVVGDARVVVSGVVSFLDANKGLVALAGRGRRAKAQRHQHPEASERLEAGFSNHLLDRHVKIYISMAHVK